MKPDHCPVCGANRNLVGYRHNCVPRQTAPAPATHFVDNGTAEDTSVDNANRDTVVINPMPAATPQTNTQRQAKWRAANRDKHRERNRDLMRRKRATERTARPAA